ncbi:MAG TPA: 2-oxo acid dehydrogenase subunit E2 [Armatimonadota bacterium]|jgi:pyruvate dehydrogenase E2 component (dihydrolipoamide acetyltransferase)
MANKPWEPTYEIIEPSAIRRAIGERTQASFRDVPQFSVSRQLHCGALIEARLELKEAGADPLPSYNDYLIKLTGLALKDLPALNSWWEDDVIKLLGPVNVGFACDTEEGILMPTVFDADRRSLVEIAAETRSLVAAARAGKLRASLQKGAGFSLTNIGPTGADQFNGIISPPQTAIVAIGALAERPVVIAGELHVEPTLWLTITLDHRVHDGRHGAGFLAAMAERLADGELLRRL